MRAIPTASARAGALIQVAWERPRDQVAWLTPGGESIDWKALVWLKTLPNRRGRGGTGRRARLRA